MPNDDGRGKNKTHLGDGVYAQFDGYHYVLTTEDGVGVTNTICLEPTAYLSFVNWVKQTTGDQTEQS